jgi:hypothetical protein
MTLVRSASRSHMHNVEGDHEDPSVGWQSGSRDPGGTMIWVDFDRATSEILDTAWQAREACIQIPNWPFITFWLLGNKALYGERSMRWTQHSARTGLMRPIRRIAVLAGSPEV